MPSNLALDHLVVAAATLAQGVQWCENTLGVTPGPGGEHGLMGTHNRLLSVASAHFPLAYLEIIAINPAAPGPSGSRKRWFGLDDSTLQARLVQEGPQLIHWVARSTALQAHRKQLLALGLMPGEAVSASRPTPHGLLQWQMLLRPDGALFFGGALPTLIEWQGRHPVQSMPACGVVLQQLQINADFPPGVDLLLQMPGLRLQAAAAPTASALTAVFKTPAGSKTIPAGLI